MFLPSEVGVVSLDSYLMFASKSEKNANAAQKIKFYVRVDEDLSFTMASKD